MSIQDQLAIQTQFELLKNIDHQVQAIFWFGENALNTHLHHFNLCNYLLDGLVSQSLLGNELFNPQQIQVFLGEQFQSTLSIVYFPHFPKKSEIDEHISMLKQNIDQNKIILLVEKNLTATVYEELLGGVVRQYPKFSFELY